MKLFRVDFKLIVILFVALFVRLLLIPAVYHPDIISQAGWGQNIAYSGTKSFYTNRVWTFSWPNHPPLVSLYYGLSFNFYRELSLQFHHSLLLLNKLNIRNTYYSDFVNSLDSMVSPEIPFPRGFMISLKIFPVVADILVGILIYYYAKTIKKNEYLYTIVYLVSPFSWYISALWGQTDQIAFLMVFLAFYLMSTKPIMSVMLFYLGVSIKPTGILLIPLYVYCVYIVSNKWKMIGLGIMVTLFVNFILFKLFTDRNYFDFIFNILLPRIFDRVPRLTTNAYNFWHIFTLNKGVPNNILILNIPAYVWGIIGFGFVNLIGFKIINKDPKSITAAVFVVSLGSWLFLTDMLDRYSFMGIVSCLLVCVHQPRLLKFWIILSFVYWLNIFRGWWYPNSFYFLKDLLSAKDYIAGFFLSCLNVITYGWIVKKISDETFVKTK